MTISSINSPASPASPSGIPVEGRPQPPSIVPLPVPIFPLASLPFMLANKTASCLSLSDMDSLTRVSRSFNRMRAAAPGQIPLPVAMQMRSKRALTQRAFERYVLTGTGVLPLTAIDACPSLQKLTFEETPFKIPSKIPGIPERCLTLLLNPERCLTLLLTALRKRRITSLRLTPEYFMRDDIFAQFIPLCRHLEILELGRDLSESSIAMIAEHCPQLKRMTTQFYLGDNLLEMLANRIPGLVSLMASDFSQKFTDKVVVPMILSRDMEVINLLMLTSREIELKPNEAPPNYDRIFHALATRASRLQEVCFEYIGGDDALRQLFSQCVALQNVTLTNNNMTDDTILELAIRSPNLRKIWLCGDRLTDRSIDSLAMHCPHLEEIEIMGQFTVRSIVTLRSFQHLQTIRACRFFVKRMETELNALKAFNPKLKIEGIFFE